MNNLYLHAGAHKTASSFLQSLLRLHQNEVKKKGVRVLFRSQVINRDFQRCLDRIGSGDERSEVFDLLRTDISDSLPKSKKLNCLITNEDLFSKISIDDFYSGIGKSIQAIKSALPNWNVVFVFYVRKQADYIESVYSQYVHLGKSLSFSEFVRNGFPDYLYWDRVLEEVAEVVGVDNVVVKPFESIKSLGGKGFYIDFLGSIGVDDLRGMDVSNDVEVSSGANRSYSGLAVEIANKVNPLLNRDEKVVLRRFLQENFSTATHARPLLFGDEKKNEIFDFYSASNERLFSKFMSGHDGAALGYF